MTDRCQALLEVLDHHEPTSDTETRSLRRTRSLLRWLPAPFDEHADATHVTASAIVIDPLGRVLLHRHKRLGLWLQPGGHLRPDEPPHEAAVRETREETGVDARHPRGGPTLVHVDVHDGGPGHVHLDLRYLLFAPDAPPRPAAGESPEVEWLDAAEAADRADLSAGMAIAKATRWIRSARVARPQ